MFVFGGFDGQFFNDWHCLNVHPFSIPLTPSIYSQKLSELVNNKMYSDLIFYIGKEKEPIHVNKSLLLYRWSWDKEPGFFF